MHGEIRNGEILQQRIPEEGREDNIELTFGHLYFEVLLEWVSGDVAFGIRSLNLMRGSRLAVVWN